MIDERGLPANADAERLVLGATLLGDSYGEVAAVLSADDFSVEKHRVIFNRIGEIANRGDHVDRVTLANELMRLGELEKVDGLSYLSRLDEGLPQMFSLDAYLRIVKEASVRRRAIVQCYATAERIAAGGGADTIAEAERTLRDLSGEVSERKRLSTVGEIIGALGGMDAFLSPEKTEPGVPFPWAKVNEWITGSGFLPGQLITLAARTGGGKTAAADQIAECAAANGHGVALFSLEMQKREVAERMACSRAKVDGRKFKNGFASREERKRVGVAAAELADMPLFIDDTSASTVSQIYSAVRRLMIEQPVKLVVVDYLQIMRPVGRFDKRADAVGSCVRELKNMAMELGVCVLVLSQFNRDNKEGGRRPQLSDLKETSEIEQASNLIVFLHSDADPGNTAHVLETEWIIAKQRNGPVGMLPLLFHRPYVRFGESMEDFAVAA